jgi:hypothetical protein
VVAFEQEEKVRPLLFFLWAVVFVGFVGCGKKGDVGEAATTGGSDKPSVSSQLPPADVVAKEGAPLMAEAPPTPPVEGLYVKPYLDEKGSVTELAVTPGQEFDIFVFGETIDPYKTSGVQYRMQIPDGIRVLGTKEIATKSLSMGDYKENYMLAYSCQPTGHFVIATYRCVAEPDFRGGEISVFDGIGGGGAGFLGFSTCDYVDVRATGGTAKLDRK